MDAELEERFDTIAQEAITAAEAIQCPFADFIEGLETIASAVNARLEAAQQEAKSREEE